MFGARVDEMVWKVLSIRYIRGDYRVDGAFR